MCFVHIFYYLLMQKVEISFSAIATANFVVMEKLELLKEYVHYKIEIDHLIHYKLSQKLQQVYPGERGFSVRSIERFCSHESISKMSRVSDEMLDEVISEAVA